MLVLSRHKDEKIVLDLRSFGLGLVEIVQTDIRGDKSRIGIQADPRIPVHRFEVFEAIQLAGAGAFTPSHAKHVVTEAIPSPRFPKTYCSQCGGEFGPGDHGYSHCEDHRGGNGAAVAKGIGIEAMRGMAQQ